MAIRTSTPKSEILDWVDDLIQESSSLREFTSRHIESLERLRKCLDSDSICLCPHRQDVIDAPEADYLEALRGFIAARQSGVQSND